MHRTHFFSRMGEKTLYDYYFVHVLNILSTHSNTQVVKIENKSEGEKPSEELKFRQ